MDSAYCWQLDNLGAGYTRLDVTMEITTLADINKLSQHEILRKLNQLEVENERLRETKPMTLPYCPKIPYVDSRN